MYVTLESVSHFSDYQANILSKELMNLQHRRLGHLSERYLQKMIRGGSAEGLEKGLDEMKHCTVCSKSKNHKLPHSSTRPKGNRPLENIHVDLSGIIQVKGCLGELYYILFCDDYTSYRHIYFLTDKTKESTYEIFKTYIAMS